ncbi:DUF2784 domain-containing protein [Krasilnikovia sp. MM14-A1004]|uniref:DUF2784 domain-containing protein n=1 Tax=Krasilnikovia sp. MM14-A1004 TaxID=3373541 RepID=UPI00399CAAC1
MGYRVLVAAAVGVHFAFLAYGVFGGFLAWRWPRTIWLHAACALWLLFIVVFHGSCPLTWLEDRSREALGEPPRVGGFLDNHVAGIFYPHGREAAAQIVVALLVLTSWVGLAIRLARRRSGRRSADRRAEDGRAGHGQADRQADHGRADRQPDHRRAVRPSVDGWGGRDESEYRSR